MYTQHRKQQQMAFLKQIGFIVFSCALNIPKTDVLYNSYMSGIIQQRNISLYIWPNFSKNRRPAARHWYYSTVKD